MTDSDPLQKPDYKRMFDEAMQEKPEEKPEDISDQWDFTG